MFWFVLPLKRSWILMENKMKFVMIDGKFINLGNVTCVIPKDNGETSQIYFTDGVDGEVDVDLPFTEVVALMEFTVGE